jgi:hypothetical protein
MFDSEQTNKSMGSMAIQLLFHYDHATMTLEEE